jgi:hypothetical protein
MNAEMEARAKLFKAAGHGPRPRKLTPNTMLIRGVLHRCRPLCGKDGKVIMRLGQPQWEWILA